MFRFHQLLHAFLLIVLSGLCLSYLFIFPILVLDGFPAREVRDIPWLSWIFLSVSFAIITPTLWALEHEAIHGLLFDHRFMNTVAGHFLGYLLGIPFHILRQGHLVHHRLNRSVLDRTEVYSLPAISLGSACFFYYIRLCGGLYVGELLTNFLVWLPRSIQRNLLKKWMSAHMDDWQANVAKPFLAAPSLWLARFDALINVSLLTISVLLYGPFIWLLIPGFMLRGFMISVFDNAYHYGTELDNTMGSFNVKLKSPWDWWLLNGNFHASHHQRPDLPWWQLPSMHGRNDMSNGFRYLWRQFQGPIPENGLLRR